VLITCNIYSKINTFSITPTQCPMFCMIITINSDYFPIQHWPPDPYKGHWLCSLWGTNLGCMYNLNKCQSSWRETLRSKDVSGYRYKTDKRWKKKCSKHEKYYGAIKSGRMFKKKFMFVPTDFIWLRTDYFFLELMIRAYDYANHSEHNSIHRGSEVHTILNSIILQNHIWLILLWASGKKTSLASAGSCSNHYKPLNKFR
jgi:hypothetical protein